MTDITPNGAVLELTKLSRTLDEAGYRLHDAERKAVLSNALHLCGSGTTGCHGMVTESPARAYDRGWSVRSRFDTQDVPVVYQGDWRILTDDGGVFVPPQGPGRCERCGFHVTTQGHRQGCQLVGQRAA